MQFSHNEAKGALLLEARYNKYANAAMCTLFLELESRGKREILYKDNGLYYKSIMGTAAHGLCGSLGLFVGQIASFAGVAHKYENLLAHLTPDFSLQKEVLDDLVAFTKLQEEVDNAMIEIVSEIHDFACIKALKVGEGVEFKRSLAHLILGLFNHSVHHRGQIAGALDILGIDNDFAGAMLGME